MAQTVEQKNRGKLRDALVESAKSFDQTAPEDGQHRKLRYKSESLSQETLAKIYVGEPYRVLPEEDARRGKKKIKPINPSDSAILRFDHSKFSSLEDLQDGFQQWLDMRDKARKNLFWLGRNVLGKDLEPHVHQIVCDQFVQKNFDGAFPEGYTLKDLHRAIDRQERYDDQGYSTKEMMLLDSRGFFKSTIDGIDVVQWFINCPDIRVFLISGEYKLGIAFLKEIKGYFYLPDGADPTNFNLLFPEYIVKGVDGTSKEPLTFEIRRHNQKEPSLWINSIDSNLSGWHCDVKKGDDVVTDENSNNIDTRAALKEKYDGTENILDPWGFSDHIGTRYYPTDWYGTRMSAYHDNPEESTIKYFCRACWTVKPEFVEVALRDLTEDMVICTFPEKEPFWKLRKKLLLNERTFRCFPAGSKVLMSDWTEKNIEDIVPGDEVVGFDKGLKKTKVTHVHRKRDMVVRAFTETGRIIHTTKKHEFLKPINRSRKQFSPLKVGGSVVSVYKPHSKNTEQQRDLDWLSGILDGEGSCGSQVCLYQSKNTNPEMCSAIREKLNFLDISFKEILDSRRNVIHFQLIGGRSLKIRLLQQTKMVKKQRFIDSLWRTSKMIAEPSGRHGGSSFEKIVSIEEIGEQIVYDLTTETSNYVCQGFSVHNCQQLNEPAGEDEDSFKVSFEPDVLKRHCYPIQLAPKEGDIFVAWDWALTANKRSDWSVGVAARVYLKSQDAMTGVKTWGLCVLEVTFGKWKDSELAINMVAFNKRWNPKKTLIEKSSGADLLNLEISRKAALYGATMDIFWKPPASQENAKRNRIKGLETLLADDRLYFVVGPWLDETFEQLTRYTGEKKNKGRKDDIPDAMSYLPYFFPEHAGGTSDSEEARLVLEQQRIQARMKANYNRMFGGDPPPAPLAPDNDPQPPRNPHDIFGGNGMRALRP